MFGTQTRATGADLRQLCFELKDAYLEQGVELPEDTRNLLERVEALSSWLESRFEVPMALGKAKDLDQLGLLG